MKNAMLRTMRSSTGARLALCAAALLSICAAFGLHPEPRDPAASAVAGRALARTAGQDARHGCPACLTHGAALAAPLSGVLPAGAPSIPVTLLADPDPGARLAGRDLSGRSPPSLS